MKRPKEKEGRGDEGQVDASGERERKGTKARKRTDRIRIDVLEVDRVPGESLVDFGLTLLSLLDLEEERERRSALFGRARRRDGTYLDLGLLPRRSIEISRLDPISSFLPKPPRLPLALSLERRDRDLLLLGGRVREELSGLQLGGLCEKVNRRRDQLLR